MALLYPWATKEYILHNMSLGQLIMYFNLGMKYKYPDPDEEEHPSYDMLKNARDEMRKLGLLDEAQPDENTVKEQLRQQYGEID